MHGEVGKSATSVGLRAPAGRFDAAKGGSMDTGNGRRAASSSPGRGPWTAGSSVEMPGGAEEGIGIEMLPLVLSLAPSGGAGCCPRPPLPWRWGLGTTAGPSAAGGSGEMPGGAEEGTGIEMPTLVYFRSFHRFPEIVYVSNVCSDHTSIKDGLWYICTYRYVISHPNRQAAPGLPSSHRPSPHAVQSELKT